MSTSSTNPVQNKVVKDYIDDSVGDIISGDIDLSSTHNHDDRYFTESEINTKLNTLANSKSKVSITPTKTSGTEIATITIDGTPTKLYQQDNNTTYGDVVAGGASGLMTGADKTKLDGIATGANKTVLNNTVNSTSTTEAATANAVKTAYDKANHSHPYSSSSHNHTTHNTQSIASGTDLNTITTAGWYNNNSNSDVQKMSNTPWQATAPSSGGVGQAFAMEVLYTYGCIQILYPYNSNDIWVRRNNSNALGANNWTGWTKVFNNANLTKADITALGIPGTDTNTTYSADNSSLQVSSNQFSVKSGGITSSHIADKTIVNGDIADATIETGKIKDSAVTSAKIADGTIVNGDIANATIQGGKLVNGTVTATQLASNCVETVKIKDANVTNSKLADLPNLITEYIVGTQTASTSAWTGKTTKITSLQSGQVIYYKLPFASTSTAVTLNLTLADGTTTGAKEVWFWNGSRVTTNYGVNSVIGLVYNGSQWWVINPSNNNSFSGLDAGNCFTTGEQVTSGKIIACKKSDGKYYSVANLSGVAIDLSQPILLATGTINANANSASARLHYPWIGIRTTISNFSGTAYKPIYLEGTSHSNGEFTISNNIITQILTSGRFYIRIGSLYNTTDGAIDLTDQPVFYYNGTNLIPSVSWNGVVNKPSTLTPSSHAHGNISNEGIITGATSKNVVTDANGKITTENKPTIPTGSSTATDIKMNGTQNAGSSSNFAKADHVHPTDTSRAASSHAHGNISNNGAIGSTANLPIITGTNGVLQASSFGTGANTFCQGNDSRLSNARTPIFNSVGASSSSTKDLNNFTTGGFYYCDSDGNAPYVSNQPRTSSQKAFFLLVETWGASSPNYTKQTLTYYDTNQTYTRTKAGSNTGWKAWVELSKDTNTTYTPASATPLVDSITGTVGTSAKYAREDHTHPNYDYTGLKGTDNTSGYVNLIKITIGATYQDKPIVVKTQHRDKIERSVIQIKFSNVNNNDPALQSITHTGQDMEFHLYKESTSNWILACGKGHNGKYDDVFVKIDNPNTEITTSKLGTHLATLPTSNITQSTYIGFTSAEKTKLSGIATGANKTTITNNLTTTSTGTALDASQGAWLYNNKIQNAGTNLSKSGTTLNHATSGVGAKSSGLYKTTIDAQGHITAATAVAKADITGLGIPAQDTTYSVATQSANGLLSSTDKKKLDGITESADSVSFTQTKTSGIEIGKININGTSTTLYQQDNNTTYSKGNGLLLSGTTFSADFGTGTNQVARGDHTHSTWTLLKKQGVAGDGRQMWLYVNEAIKMCTLYVSEVINSFPANSTHAIYPDTQWVPDGYIPKHPTIGSGSYSSIMIVGSDGKIVLRNGSQAQSSVQVWAHATWIY